MGCEGLPDIEVYDFLKPLRSRGVPLGGAIELTWRCNLSCVHCYCRVPADDTAVRQRELSTDQVCSILDQAAKEGCFHVFFTGGEPLLRADLVDIWVHAKKLGLLVTLFTNGTLLTHRFVDLLVEYTPLNVEISLYGLTKDTYERVTGVHGSYERCMTGIQLLLERGLRVDLKTPVLTVNRHELQGLRAYAEQLGTTFRYDAGIFPRLDGDRSPLQVCLSSKEVVAAEFDDPANVDQRLAQAEKLLNNPSRGGSYTCGAGWTGFSVDPEGCMGMCIESRVPGYDLVRGSFGEGWKQLRVLREGSQAMVDPSCAQCALLPFCDMCPGQAQLEYGADEFRRPIPRLCSVANARMRVLRQLRPSSSLWFCKEVRNERFSQESVKEGL